MQTINIRRNYTIEIPSYGEHISIEQIIDAMKRAGSHFFDKDSMRFFRSRLDYHTYAGVDGWYFVTSEKHESAFARINEPRRYTVRFMTVKDNDLRLYELEEFQAYKTLTAARNAAKKAAQLSAAWCHQCEYRKALQGICQECKARAERKATQQQ